MNLRKENRVKNLEAWQKQGPAIIEKPLRYIKARNQWSLYEDTKLSADKGDGIEVKYIARYFFNVKASA